MTEETVERLNELATGLSTTVRKVSPMQLAAQILEEGLERFAESAEEK